MSYRIPHVGRLAGGLLVLVAVATSSGRPAIADPQQRPPVGDVVTIEINRPLALWNHPLLQDLRREIRTSSRFQAATRTPQFDRLRLLQQLVEQGTGKTWEKGLETLTAGGIRLSFSPKQGKPDGLTVTVTAAEEKTLKRFLSTALEHIHSRLPEPQRDKAIRRVNRNGLDYFRVGKAAYTVVGRTFFLATDEQRLQRAVTFHRGRKPPAKSKPTKPPTSQPVVRFTVNMEAVRKSPDVKKGLRIPSDDAGLVAIFGGWIDLLRRSKQVTGELTVDKTRLEFRLQSDARRSKTTPGLEGYFADGQQNRAAPLLEIPGTIYAASWYRDYRSLWKSRSQLLAAKPLKQLEEGNKTLQQQLSVIGAKVLPSRAFSLLGTHFRVVAVRQETSEYRVNLPSRTPAAGLAVDLRNEAAFREEVVPLLRGIGLIAAFGEAKMLTRKSKHAGAELTSLRFRDDSVSAAKGNRLRFNLAPTYAITRGHFLVGTTRAVVTQMIDELDRQSRLHVTSSGSVTERQRLSLKEAAVALGDVQSLLTLQLAFGEGFSVNEAKAELQVLRRVLERLGTVTTDAGFDEGGFRYRIRLGGR